MNYIFNFIFSCLRDIFNFLNFDLPGVGLTFIEFFLLALIIPLIFRLVRGVISNSGEDTIFGVMSSFGDISNTASLSYHNYKSNIGKKQLIYSSKRDDPYIINKSNSGHPSYEQRRINQAQRKKDLTNFKRSYNRFLKTLDD